MKKMLAAAMLVAFAATTALAAGTTYKASNGDVAYPAIEAHKDAKAPEKFASKDEAHKFCKGCHETKQKGPTKCGQCHKNK